ncbi:phosphatase PAP2 family protein [Mucilaginibacter sp.]|uniref:phosphatase PAP2 family protein n=1 Tax=Mucilaginibacter sp. TaxID=1882438 RepID=UPI003B0071B2
MKAALKTTCQKINTLLYPYLVLLLICIVLMLIFSKTELYFAINHLHTVFTDVFFASFTILGASIGCIIIVLITFLINFRSGFLLASSYIITFIISQTIKHLVKAPRPHLFFSKKLHDIYLIKGVVMLNTNSFPSGHSVSAFTAAVVFTYAAKNKRWGVFWLLIAVLIAYSRMYLSEHFLQDVTAGSALGVLITVFWLSWIDQQPFLHTKKWNRGIFR